MLSFYLKFYYKLLYNSRRFELRFNLRRELYDMIDKKYILNLNTSKQRFNKTVLSDLLQTTMYLKFMQH